jgi:carboxylesterase type B
MISVLIGLFHKAILHSGTGTCNWAVNESTPEVYSFRLASVLGNDSKDPEAVAKFLRSLPVEKIIQAQHNVLTEEVSRIS